MAAFEGDIAQNQLSFDEGDIIKLLPGGSDEWGIGLVAFSNGELLHHDQNTQGKFFPMTFCEVVDWSPEQNNEEFVKALGTFNGDPSHNQISFEEGDVIHVLEVAPGGDADWIVGIYIYLFLSFSLSLFLSFSLSLSLSFSLMTQLHL